MNYDRIILELLDRVSKLEDEVKKLKGENPKQEMHDESKDEETEWNACANRRETYTDKACNVIYKKIEEANSKDEEYVDIVSNDLQHAIGLKNRIPLCCNAMRKVAQFYKTKVLVDTPSHNSSTYTIRYWVG